MPSRRLIVVAVPVRLWRIYDIVERERFTSEQMYRLGIHTRLRLPEDVVIDGVSEHVFFCRDCVALRLGSCRFDEVEEACVIPERVARWDAGGFAGWKEQREYGLPPGVVTQREMAAASIGFKPTDLEADIASGAFTQGEVVNMIRQLRGRKPITLPTGSTYRALSEESKGGEMVVPPYVKNEGIVAHPPTEDQFGPMMTGVLDAPGGLLRIKARWHVRSVNGVDELIKMTGNILEPHNSLLQGGHYYATFDVSGVPRFQICMRVNANSQLKSSGAPSVGLTCEQMLGVPGEMILCGEPVPREAEDPELAAKFIGMDLGAGDDKSVVTQAEMRDGKLHLTGAKETPLTFAPTEMCYTDESVNGMTIKDEQHACTCPLDVLTTSGCKCGGK